MDTTEQLPTVVSFCSGYGGIERGLDLAGYEHRVISYVEIEAFCCENLATKMENEQLDAAPIWTNLKTFPAHVFRDKVSLITGGYPCQPFSAAGQRKGTEDPRHLWPYIKEHIKTIRPLRVFFENVEGHISLGLREVIGDLESLGYVCAWGIFSAREVGAPHQRKRVYILADSKREQDNAKRPLVESGWERLGRQSEATQRENGKTSTNSPYRCGIAPHELGDSQNNRLSGGSKDSQRERSENIGERSDKDLRSKSERSSQTLAHSISEGSQGSRECRPDTREAETGTQSAHGDSRCVLGLSRDLWPSRPGQDQHAWEASRTLEPRMGRATNGTSDRVDRIRALGNGVTPQTATKAWQILGDKL